VVVVPEQGRVLLVRVGQRDLIPSQGSSDLSR
jgi:hypothetical protein